MRNTIDIKTWAEINEDMDMVELIREIL